MAGRRDQIANILKQLNPLNEENRRNFSQGLQHDYQIGREDMQQAFYRKRELDGEQKEAPRFESMKDTHPGAIRLSELTGKIDSNHLQALVEADLQLRKDLPMSYQGGQLVGTALADLTQDSTRSVYWLMNALQAVGDVSNEMLLASKTLGTPELWKKSPVTRDITTKSGKVIETRGLRKDSESDMDYAREQNLLRYVDDKEVPRRGYSFQYDEKGNEVLHKRNYEPGMLAALAVPSGVAINNALGLLTPTGGPEGYKANNPSPDDPTKSNNVVMEVAQKYILGKSGQMLPYDEFSKVRPGVSRAEYNMYQADRYDNSEDWNPFDGDIALLGGALKANVEGIHGPEISMLGRSLPATTGVIPLTASIAGTLAGARYGHHQHKKGAMGGLVGGLGATVAGIGLGNIIEGERRRRNGIENGELPLQ